MNQSYTRAQHAHIAAVKSLPCSVCDAAGPSEAHHIEQQLPYCCIALCASCHRDEHNGWHGRKAMWRIRKLDELAALNITLGRLLS
jgi:hypothetical protein